MEVLISLALSGTLTTEQKKNILMTIDIDIADIRRNLQKMEQLRDFLKKTDRCCCEKFALMSATERLNNALPDCSCNGENKKDEFDDIGDGQKPKKTKSELDLELEFYFSPSECIEEEEENICYCKKFALMSRTERLNNALPDCSCNGENKKDEFDDISHAQKPKKSEYHLDLELKEYFSSTGEWRDVSSPVRAVLERRKKTSWMS